MPSSRQRPSYRQGDVVTCIDASGSGSHKLTAGKKYVVIRLYIDVDKDWMADVTDVITGDHLGEFYSSRFTSHPYPHEAIISGSKTWSYEKVVEAAASLPAINDKTCPSCGNTKCSSSERSCWLCGNLL